MLTAVVAVRVLVILAPRDVILRVVQETLGKGVTSEVAPAEIFTTTTANPGSRLLPVPVLAVSVQAVVAVVVARILFLAITAA
jgi:hypothetical protein